MPDHTMSDQERDELPDDLLVRSLEIRSFDEATREFDVVVSTPDEDMHESIVVQNWDLTRYKSNPVVLYAHSRSDLPIGRMIDVGVKDGALQGRVRLASEKANPMAERVYNQLKEGMLRGVSAGFRPRDVSTEMRDGRAVMVLDNNELVEASIVPIPSNPKTMARLRSRAAGAADCGSPEKPMSDPEVTVEHVAAAPEIDERDAKLAERDAAVADLTKSVAAMTAERDAYKATAAAHESRMRELQAENAALKLAANKRDVESLVGVKITRAQADAMLKVAAVSPEVFAESLRSLADFPDLTVTSTQPTIGPAPAEPKTNPKDDAERYASALLAG